MDSRSLASGCADRRAPEITAAGTKTRDGSRSTQFGGWAASCMALLLLTGTARAALLAYEGFDYPTNTTIAGQSGGSLWTNAWASGTSQGLATNVAGSLGYTDAEGRSLQTSGGSLIIGNPVGTTSTTANPNRALNANLSGGTNTTAGPGRTNWISFLYQRLNFVPGPYFRQANLGLYEGGTDRGGVGSPNTSSTNFHLLSLWGSGLHGNAFAFQSPDHPITPGTTYFVLMRIVADGTTNNDPCHVWFNWTNLLVEPSISSATLTNSEVNFSGVNILRLQAGNANSNGSNAVWQADELRLGTTFADVTPNFVSGSAPFINSPPADQTVTVGDPANFSVNAGGSVPLSYQWYFNTNTPLLSETNSTLAIASAQTNNAGAYHVVITNSVGSTTSTVATLTVLPPAPPSIGTQPTSRSVVAGYGTTFSVLASGYAPLRYQWRLNDVPLVNETNATFGLAAAQTNNAGTYTVIITNSVSAITSSPANLNVIYVGPAGLPAFPGADGAAKLISGGRGGTVYHVTKVDRNYSHAEAGTLRYGLTDGNFPPGVPRTIVFDVAGTFWLGKFGAESNHTHGWDTASRYNLSSHTTIAGQTAPGPVVIAGGVTKPGGVNTIVRNVTFAPSYGTRSFQEDFSVPPTPGDFPDSYAFDALDISGQNILLDHLTTIYGTDETISANELAANLTIQYCTLAQAENYPQADAENPGVYTGHALGSLLQAGSNARVSVLHNFYAHLANRLPRVGSEVGSGALNDFRNNVFYNWFSTAGSGANGQPSFNNFINNFYLAGDGGDSVSSTNITSSGGGTGIFNGASASFTRAFVSGNLKDTNKDADPNDTTSADSDYSSIAAQVAAYDIHIGVTLAASAGFTNVLRYSGARWWERDYDIALGNTGAINTVDERLAHEAATGTGRIEAWADDPFDSSPTEGLEWQGILALRADPVTGAAPFNRPVGWDTDDDGLPDAWETERGLNPNVANNNGDFDNDGYTDLEEYLNETAAWPAPGAILFTAADNNRYAEIFNWRVHGVTVNIAGSNTTTFSLWQPSRYDAVLVSNQAVIVDAVGQHAGTLRLTHSAMLNVTNGWLKLADKLDVGSGCTVAVGSGAALSVGGNLVNQGTLRLTGSAGLTVSGTFTNTGTLDVMTWNGTLPGGLVNNGVVLTRSAIQITSASPNGTNFAVTLTGYTGHNYQLEYRDALNGGTWQAAGSPVAGAGAPVILTHPGGSTAQQRFYRVAVNP
jgi:hypothetical protein